MKFITVLAAFTAVVSATHHHCDNDLFWWGHKNHCLPSGGLPIYNPPPSGRNCGERWYWHGDLGCCVPPHPGFPDAGCWSGWGWDDHSYSCIPYKGHH